MFDATTYPALDHDIISLVDGMTLVVLNKKDLIQSCPSAIVHF